ncbi:PEP-utilizing enzyme [Oceanidesulfovibrio marinus]|uniref:PEP-utilising enzyme mobile domain-containing protein n=1 Tax=Oceanidesulfovibrio marinus TaxID=370038 RepID=A0A6P1ZCW1_9BACT|nr:PEP-utilizing enzyme [Oceanidesulfovibrio marinus]TVM31524.1 hypothetical protein DQK91_17810 [Oceanidesulfovibrio marinus]
MAGYLRSLFSRRGGCKQEQESPTSLRSLFHKFRRILELNNAIMEKMAELESALGGEYIFDNAFLSRAVRDMSGLVHQVAYSLNAMTDDRYVELYDRYEYIKGVLDDILSGGLGPQASRLAMGFPELHWENLPLAGMPNVCLAELLRTPHIGAVDGFVVTVTACRLMQEKGMTPKLEQAILRETDALWQRLGRPEGLAVSACPAGGSEPASGLPAQESNREHIVRDVLEACRKGVALGWRDMAVGVRERVPSEYRGRLRTCCPESRTLGAMSLAMSGPAGEEHYNLRRAHPFPPAESDIRPKDEAVRLPDGVKPLTPVGGGLLRGSGLLPSDSQRLIAEAGIVLERALGAPQELHLCLDREGVPRILDAAVAEIVEEAADADDLAAVLDQAKVLLRGGNSAQAGAAAGKVVHIKEGDDPEEFPLGAVAVARAASPQLAPFLLKAGALVTELGSTIGHLATVAREYRIPAVFGAAGALKTLKPGAEVTVDASVPVVYAGSLDILLSQSRAGSELYATDPEFTTLRRLLQFIMPLKLTDSGSESFAPQNCRSFHDIIHFAHERAVEELLDAHEGGGACIEPHRLEMRIPLNIGLVDAGGGLAEDAGPVVTRDDILSEPMHRFLGGLRYAWDNRENLQVSMRDIFSGMQRTAAVLQAPAEQGMNLAILATGYFNLSLHMGYHYSVVDAFMQDNPHQNYIYFRFAGGFADAERKNRRAELIRRVLATLQFNVEMTGDLVTGRLKIVDRETMADALEQLGILTAFTRQLDISMGREDSLGRMEQAFREVAAQYEAAKELP